MKHLSLSIFASTLVICASYYYSHKSKSEVNTIKENPIIGSDLVNPHRTITKKLVIDTLMTKRSQDLIRASFESTDWKVDPSKIIHVKSSEDGANIVASYLATNSNGETLERYEWFVRNAFGEFEWNGPPDKNTIIIPSDL